MNTRTKHALDALAATAAVVAAIGEALGGVLNTTPGLVVPFGVLAAVRITVAVANILKAPPTG